MPFVPHFYQETAISEMLQKPAYGLFLDPGLGKTAITLAAFDLLRQQGIVNRMLVIAPLRVCYDVWPDEIRKWTDFQHLKFEILHGPKKEERLTSNADVFLLNPEGVEWLVQKREKATSLIGYGAGPRCSCATRAPASSMATPTASRR